MVEEEEDEEKISAVLEATSAQLNLSLSWGWAKVAQNTIEIYLLMVKLLNSKQRFHFL